MLVSGSDNMQSTHSTEISSNARNSQINSKLEMHDYSLNELNNVIKDSMANIDRKADLISDMVATMNIKVDKVVLDAQKYVEEHAKQNEIGMNAALEMISNFETRLVDQMKQIKKSQDASDARADESLKAGMALVASIEETKKQGMQMIKAVHEQSNRAIELGERALNENKLALKSFGRGLEGYAKERDKKAEEITLVNVEKLFKQLIEMRVKGIGDFSKVSKKS